MVLSDVFYKYLVFMYVSCIVTYANESYYCMLIPTGISSSNNKIIHEKY